ncbi:hypothetical protein FRC02_008443 [Tulasnella sp. 418]|nr:hypothetical protein FRC02_008443 [Tulasnella sp. 418]
MFRVSRPYISPPLKLISFGKQGTAYSRNRRASSIKVLQDAFKDPSSPFYLAPGTQGPSEEQMMNLAPSPEVHRSPAEASTLANAEGAEEWALANGYDPLSFWEQKVVWGDLDSFRHLNNVRYVRFIESGRMKYFAELAKRLDEARAKDMMEGKGKSIILKSISVNFKRPHRSLV